MIPFIHFYTAAVVASTSLVSAHISIWTNSMWGFNVTNGLRPQDPLMNLPFDQWWFHGHLGHPPHPDDIMQLPVGQKSMTELSCDKDSTSYWPSGPGGNQQDPNNPDYPCPGQPTTQFHTNGIDDLGGCALAVAYKSDVNDVQPEDFVVFSVNQTCVWNLHTYFEVPADMPPCPNNKCTCAWFWIHRPDSGSEQNYMTGFQCNFANAVSTKKLGTPKVPRRCGPEQSNNFTWNYSNCTYGPKQPFYWYQAERNNMFEGTYDAPNYRDLYHFLDGAQNDIFENTTDASTQQPSHSSSLPSSDTCSPANHTVADADAAAAAQPPSSSSPPKETQTPSPSDPHSSKPATQPYSYGPAPDSNSTTPHTQAAAAKSTTPADGPADTYQPSQHDSGQDQSSSHHHHHGHSGQCTCRHRNGSHHKSRSIHPSWNYLRDSDRAEEHALRRAWGAHRRRSVDN